MSLLNDVSIVVTPNGYGVKKLHAVVPISGAADMVVTRATDAIRVNEDGLIESVLSNVPRIDYTGGGCPHILAEPQRTNLITYSEAFDNSYWTKTGSSVVSGFTSPDGTANAFKLIEDSSNSKHQISSTVVTTSGYVSASVFSKYLSRYLRLTIHNSTNANKWYCVIYDLQNGNIYDSLAQTVSVFDSKIEQMTNGYYRCVISADLGTNSTTLFYIQTSNGADILSSDDRGRGVYQGDGTSGVYLFGAQLEVGSFSTSYILTSGSTVTRNKDQFTKNNLANLINSTEGVLFVEIAALSNDLSTRIISLSDGSDNNRIHLFYHSVSNGIAVNYRVGGVTRSSSAFTFDNITNFNKIAYKYKSGDFALWCNGVEVATQTNTTMLAANVLNKLAFEIGTGTAQFFGKVKQLQVYKTALTDNQLMRLTSESYESYSAMASALTYTIQ